MAQLKQVNGRDQLQDVSKSAAVRQRPEVYDLCHTILHVARARKHTVMRESQAFPRIARISRAILAWPCISCAILAWLCVFWLAQREKTCDKI